MLQVNLISGQNNFNLGWFALSLSLFMIMNTRDKEITDQPGLNHFDMKSNSTCNIHIELDVCCNLSPYLGSMRQYYYFWQLQYSLSAPEVSFFKAALQVFFPMGNVHPLEDVVSITYWMSWHGTIKISVPADAWGLRPLWILTLFLCTGIKEWAIRWRKTS